MRFTGQGVLARSAALFDLTTGSALVLDDDECVAGEGDLDDSLEIE